MKNQLSEKQYLALGILEAGNGKFSYSRLNDFECVDGGHDDRPLACNCRGGFYAEEVPGAHVGITEFDTMIYYINVRTLRSLEKQKLVEWTGGNSGQITPAGRGVLQAAV